MVTMDALVYVDEVLEVILDLCEDMVECCDTFNGMLYHTHCESLIAHIFSTDRKTEKLH